MLMLSDTVTSIDPAFGTLIDVDVSEDGEWVGLFERDGVLTIRDASRSRDVHAAIGGKARVRCLDANRVVVADSWSHSGAPNAWILGWSTSECRPFDAGHAIEEVLARGDRIVVTYFDEGACSELHPSYEGLAVFDGDGHFRAGYHSALGARAVRIDDCYAACWQDARRVAFCAYTSFDLVSLDVDTLEQIVHPTPRRFHGSQALSLAGTTALFLRGEGRTRLLFAWTPGASAIRIAAVDRYPGPMRGLGGGRFLTHGAHDFTVVRYRAEPID